MWAEFHFLRPAWLLLPLAALAFALIPHRLRALQGAWRPWVDDALAPWVLVRPSAGGTRSSLWAWSIPLSLTLLGVACAGPTWERRPQPQVVSGHALVIALDLSRSMLAEDIRPSRLVRARFKLADLLESRGAAQTGLIVYAADAFLVTPLTSDIETLRLQLPVLEPSLMPVQGSRADLAYLRATELLREAGFPKGDVLLVTDDISEASARRLGDACLDSPNALWILAASTPGGAPVPGLAPRESGGQEVVMSRLDLPAVQAAAERCNGRAVVLGNDDEDVTTLTRAFETRAMLERARDARLESMEWVDAGPWLLLLLLPVLAWQMRRQAWSLALPVVLFTMATPDAEAFEVWRLWEHPDEHARSALENGRPAEAMQSFSDARWKAWAAAEAGEFEATVDLLSSLEDAESLYNRGTALARLGRFPEALQTLEAALEREPGHADARFNRDLIARMLQGQQDPAQESSGSGEQSEEGSSGEPRNGEAPRADPKGSDRGEQAEGEPPQADLESAEGGASSPSATPQESAAGQEPTPGRDEQTDARENAQATEQWLTRIPDDPGGLLRNKFLYQSQRRRTAAPPDQEPPW